VYCSSFTILQVVLLPNQTLDDGMVIAKDIMSKLDIGEHLLIKGAYMNLLKP
jgi:hypothetical protein